MCLFKVLKCQQFSVILHIIKTEEIDLSGTSGLTDKSRSCTCKTTNQNSVSNKYSVLHG